MLIPHKALVVVADGGKFLLLRNVGDFRDPVLVFEGNGEKENPPTQMYGTDVPGRSPSYGNARSAMEPTDFHQLEENRFAGDVAGLLERLADAGDFEKLIVVAPPRTLAELRKRFSRSLSNCVMAEVGKDLTNHPVAEIAAILSRCD
jgi:protein required for attachment to host cells